MPVTLADARTLLERALTHISNPAILRLPESERTAEGILRAYLPGSISQRLNGRWFPINVECITRGGLHGEPLDLSDPGTCHAALVVLALALGHDPGLMALEVMLSRIDQPARRVNDEQEDPIRGWFLYTTDGGRPYCDDDEEPAVYAIAAEPDPIKALALMVHHVVAEKDAP